MNLFQSEWLREPPQPRTGSYARPSYGIRQPRESARAEPASAAIDLRFLSVPTLAPMSRRRPVASFDRAA